MEKIPETRKQKMAKLKEMQELDQILQGTEELMGNVEFNMIRYGRVEESNHDRQVYALSAVTNGIKALYEQNKVIIKLLKKE